MKEQSSKQNWVRVETEQGSLGATTEMLGKIRNGQQQEPQSEEQKKRVVYRLMSRLWEES